MKIKNLGMLVLQTNRGVMTEVIGLQKALVVALGMLIAVLTWPAASFAQESTLEEIVVTGTHIRRDTYSSPSPITVLNGEVIAQLGESNIGDFLARTPSITSDLNASSGASTLLRISGTNITALRNLGSSRTLVLVNGRRYVSGVSAAVGYGVDLNSISPTMIDRIEVLTGGQSAVYGSDAIAGVINIITKTNFEGVALKAQVGQNSQGNREQQRVDLTLGKNFDDTNAWMSVSYTNDEGLLSRERDIAPYSRSGIDTDGDGLRDTFMFEGSSFVPQTRLLGGGLSLNGDGSPFNGGRDLATTDRLNFYEDSSLSTALDRVLVAGGLTLAKNEKSKATIEFNYSRVNSYTQREALPLRLPSEVFATNQGAVTGIDLATHPLWVGSLAGSQFLAAGITSLDDVRVFVRMGEFAGPRASVNVRSTFRVVGAFDFDFDNGFHLNTYGTYGVTDQIENSRGLLNLERARFALDIEPDGFGGYQCVDLTARVAGCAPFNPFGTIDSVAAQAGVAKLSEAARDYLSVTGGVIGQIEQTVVSAVLSGDLPFNVGAEDNVGFAAGIEYRKEQGSDTPDGIRQKGIARGFSIPPTSGEIDLFEIFGEVEIPLVKQLTLSLAARFGDYSTVGNISSWKVGLNAPINDSIRFRAAVSTAIRAPNISDLFAGKVRAGTVLLDICGGVDNATTGIVADNCRSIPAIQDSITALGAFPETQISMLGEFTTAGSPTVQEETADSYNLGVIYTPEALETFSFSVDFYSIDIEDGVTLPNTEVLMTNCHNVPTSAFDPTCGGLITRNVNTGLLLNIDTVVTNGNKIATSGIDLEASYSIDNLGSGDLLISLGANFLLEFELTDIDGRVEDVKGEVAFPEARFNLNFDYNVNNLNLFAQMRYQASTVDRNENAINNKNLNEIDSAFYLDLRGSYRVNDSTTVYLGATNVLDQDPPNMGFQHKYMDTPGTNGTMFDLIGRQIYVGVNAKF